MYDMEQNPREFAQLLATLKRAKVRSICEVGVFRGGTLMRFREAFPHINVVGIDPRPVFEMRGVVVGCSQDPDVRKRARSLNDGEPFDFVFIDGDHSASGVREDWRWAKEEARIVAFHDIYSIQSCPDVVAFWRELVEDGDYIDVDVISYDNDANGIGVVWTT